MESERRNITLKNAVEFVVDNRGKTVPICESGIPLIATNCVSNDDLYPVHKNVRYVSHQIYKSWFRAHPRPNDILLTNKGSQNGAICLVPEPVDFCIAQDMVALRADPLKIDPGYLFAALRSTQVQSQIKNLNVDSVIPHFKKTDFDKLFIPLPTDCEQKAIGKFYLAFCKKIELNRRMNGTLEGMAQALFKSWFVDFDPVIDNAIAAGNPIPEELADRAEVRRAALADGTANRQAAKPFPAAFQQTEELGWIPQGWKLSTVGSHVSLQRGTTYKSRLKGLPGPYLLGLGSIQRNGGFKENTLKTYGGECPPKMVLKPGDIFVSLKDITQAADLLGSVARLPHHISSGRLTQDTVKLVFESEPVSKDYIYNMLLTERYRDHCRSHATGTTNLGLAREDFFGFPFAMPSSEVQIAYDCFVQSCNEKHQVNTAESISLTKLRDTLLPKLISGELRIPDAEKLAEAAFA